MNEDFAKELGLANDETFNLLKDDPDAVKCTSCKRLFVQHSPSITDEPMCDSCFANSYSSEIRRADR